MYAIANDLPPNMSNERIELLSILASGNSRAIALKTKELVSRSPEALAVLFSIIENDTDHIAQRASNAFGHFADGDTELILPFIPKLVEIYLSEARHPSFGRNLLRVVEQLPIECLDNGRMVDKCISNLTDAQVSIAEKAYSIGILDRVTSVYPVLAQEVIPLLKQALPYQTPAFVSRAQKYIHTHQQIF